MDWFLYDNGLRHERVQINLKADDDIIMLRSGTVIEMIYVNMDKGYIHHMASKSIRDSYLLEIVKPHDSDVY